LPLLYEQRENNAVNGQNTVYFSNLSRLFHFVMLQ